MGFATNVAAGAMESPRRRGPPRAGPWLVAAAATLLGACATGVPYQPAEGGDAAKLRVRVVFPEHYRSPMSAYHVTAEASPRAATGGACGKALAVPSMRSPTIDPFKLVGRATQYPRAGMVGATAADNPESVELQLSPGLQVVDLRAVRAFGNVSRLICESQVALQLAPNRQYELTFGFTDDGRCRWENRRLDGNTFVPAPVLKHGKPGEICQGTQLKL